MFIKPFLKKIIPPLIIKWSHKARGMLAAVIYGFPGRKLKVIGVTGTNGKTTTCHMTASILEKAGFKVGLASTIRFRIAKKETVNDTNMTTVSPFVLQKMLASMVEAKCDYAILETTSHAIDQYRNWGINYEVAVLTNITHDHLDYHQTFANYRNIKLKLFLENNKIHIVNLNDSSAEYFLQTPSHKTLTYGISNQKADLFSRNIKLLASGSIFELASPIGNLTVNLKIPGIFNVENSLAASAIAISQDISVDVIKKALEKMETVPGRMEKIKNSLGIEIIIDYAHTPDALEKIYRTIRPIIKGRLISVLGACGDRDKTKRPLLGALAGKFADTVIITNEEPYAEDPEKIIEMVAAGMPRGKNFLKISNRRKAIHKALSLAKNGDAILITGMGDQRYMVVGREHVPWNEREVVKEELAKLNSKSKMQKPK